jgi:hypothetical protein
MSRSATNTRNLHRVIHLIGGAVLGTFIYSPLRDVPWFCLATQAVVVPLVTMTGLWLWKGHALRSWLRRANARPAAAPDATARA